MDAYIRAVAFLSRAAGVFAAFLIGIAVLVICDMVIERYILNRTTIWQIDVVTYCIVSATFVGSAYVLMTRGHVNVDVLPLYLGPRARYWFALAPSLSPSPSCSCCSCSAPPIGIRPGSTIGTPTRCGARDYGFPYLAMPIGLGLLVLQYAAELMSLLTGRAPPFGIPEKASAEEVAQELAREALGGAG